MVFQSVAGRGCWPNPCGLSRHWHLPHNFRSEPHEVQCGVRTRACRVENPLQGFSRETHLDTCRVLAHARVRAPRGRVVFV
jgi:hypothetical protein